MDTTSETLLNRLRLPADEEAWTRFVSLYTPLLFFWAYKAGLRDSDAADLVQDVFCVLVRKLPEFEYDAGRSFRAWLRTVLVNTLRNNRRRVEVGSGPIPAGSEPVAPEHLVDLEEAEYRRHLVARALDLMQVDFEPTTWRACWMCTADGIPATEVAASLGVTVNAVYLANSRVLSRLRRLLHGLLD